MLRAGMDFLRDEGRAVGCYARRYLRVAAEQDFEYLNCHPGTGMLRALPS